MEIVENYRLMADHIWFILPVVILILWLCFAAERLEDKLK